MTKIDPRMGTRCTNCRELFEDHGFGAPDDSEISCFTETGMWMGTTVRDAIAVIKMWGIAVKYDRDNNEFRITTGGEAAAYYTDDADDAVATARMMVNA